MDFQISRHPTIYGALNVRGGVIKIKNFPGVSTSLSVFAKITYLQLVTVQLWCAISKKDK